MSEDLYVVAIAALLPLTAGILVCQVNPYHALVIRGILGAIAALVYALFGAADVALTEALVGTMLSITLYAVAVRSSLSMRLGLLETQMSQIHSSAQLLCLLRETLSKYHMRLELVTYINPEALESALIAKEIHTTLILLDNRVAWDSPQLPPPGQPLYHIQTRVPRLYELMLPDIPGLRYWDGDRSSVVVPNIMENQL